MSKSKRKRKPKKKPPPPEPEPVEEEELTPEERAVQGWLESLGEVPPDQLRAVKMYVFRRKPTEFQGYITEGYLGILECGADYYEVLEAVRERFGGGIYLIQLRLKGRISMGHTVHVAGPPVVGTRSGDKKGMQWAPEVVAVVSNIDERVKTIEGKLDNRSGGGMREMLENYGLLKKVFEPKTNPGSGSPTRDVIQQLKEQRELQALVQDMGGGGEGEPGEGEEEVDENDMAAQIERYIKVVGEGIERAVDVFDKVFPQSSKMRIREELAHVREFMQGGMKAAAVAQMVARRAGPGLLEQLKRHGPEGLAGLMRGAGVAVSDDEKTWLGAFVRAL